MKKLINKVITGVVIGVVAWVSISFADVLVNRGEEVESHKANTFVMLTSGIENDNTRTEYCRVLPSDKGVVRFETVDGQVYECYGYTDVNMFCVKFDTKGTEDKTDDEIIDFE